MLSIDQDENVNWFVSLEIFSEEFVDQVDPFVEGFGFVVEFLFQFILILDARVHDLGVARVNESDDKVQENDKQKDLLKNPIEPNELDNQIIQESAMMITPVIRSRFEDMSDTIFEGLKDISLTPR